MQGAGFEVIFFADSPSVGLCAENDEDQEKEETLDIRKGRQRAEVPASADSKSREKKQTPDVPVPSLGTTTQQLSQRGLL